MRHVSAYMRGSFQKFCTLYAFSLKMNLFYKIHLQTSNVICIVRYHSVPTFGKVLYSCLDAFVFDASDYSGHLIRHLLNVSEAVCRTFEMTHADSTQQTLLRLFMIAF
jgi:hypothetical protein